MREIGPVQMLAVTFGPDADYQGRIMDELTRLQDESVIRIIDLLFVLRDTESDEFVTVDHQGEALGNVVGAILGLDGQSVDVSAEAEGGSAFGLTRAEILSVAESLEPGHAVGYVMFEHVWALDLKKAIREAGGTPAGEGFLTPELVRSLEPELAAAADRG